MKKNKFWTIAGLLLLIPFTGSCTTGKTPCQYDAPKSALPIKNLVGDLADPIATDDCKPFDLNFRRLHDSTFLAVIKMRQSKGPKCKGLSGAPVKLTSSRGIVSEVEDLGNGNYVALITPDGDKTGEYVVRATSSWGDANFSTRRTALVFDSVNQRWGQPQAVEGLVNTLGWEDSAFITPNGEYLLIMYLPVSPSCLMEEKKHKDPRCHRVQGKVTKQNRPQFASRFASGRLRKNGEIDMQCLEVGPTFNRELFKTYDVYVPPMMTYGFRRQPDGSFADPFPITIEGVSACASPSGLEVQPTGNGKMMALFGLVDPASWNTPQKDDYPSMYTANIELGKINVLATWKPDQKQLDTKASDLKILFGAPLKKRQDNPHGVINPKTKRIEALFWDSQHDDEDIFYRLLAPGGDFPDGPWGPIMKTPVFSDPNQTEIQPFFDGNVLTIHKRYAIVSRDFLGNSFSDIAKPKAWGPERTELAVCAGHDGTEANVLHAVGEPTYADINGKKALYFVYLLRRDNGMLDMNVGFVEEK